MGATGSQRGRLRRVARHSFLGRTARRAAPLAYGSTDAAVAGTSGSCPQRLSAVHRRGCLDDEGDEGPEVLLLQQELARHGLYRAEVDGVFARPQPTPWWLSTRCSGWSGPGPGKRPTRCAWRTSSAAACRSARASRSVEWTSAARCSTSLSTRGDGHHPVSTPAACYWSVPAAAYVGAGTPHGTSGLTRHSAAGSATR